MKKLSILTLTIIGTAGIVWAASAHLKGKNAVLFVDNILTLTGTASYAGLGNFDTLQRLDATANPTATCTNPAGQTQPPGQNPAEVDVTGSTAVPAGDIKNGNVTIATTTSPPLTPIPGAGDCPNPQWTEAITDMAFTSATIRLFQDSNENGMFEDGELVLTVNCTFSPPTSDGSVPASGFTCTTDPALGPGTHTLTVNNGSGGGQYKAGELVTVTAAEPPDGETFESWIAQNPDGTTSDYQVCANPWLETTTVTMANMDVQMTPKYKKK